MAIKIKKKFLDKYGKIPTLVLIVLLVILALSVFFLPLTLFLEGEYFFSLNNWKPLLLSTFFLSWFFIAVCGLIVIKESVFEKGRKGDQRFIIFIFLLIMIFVLLGIAFPSGQALRLGPKEYLGNCEVRKSPKHDFSSLGYYYFLAVALLSPKVDLGEMMGNQRPYRNYQHYMYLGEPGSSRVRLRIDFKSYKELKGAKVDHLVYKCSKPVKIYYLPKVNYLLKTEELSKND